MLHNEEYSEDYRKWQFRPISSFNIFFLFAATPLLWPITVEAPTLTNPSDVLQANLYSPKSHQLTRKFNQNLFFILYGAVK
jgi:hypothetical protein